MDTILSEYQRWKQQGASIRAQAKQAMEARFKELLLEAAQIAQDYKEDFGAQLKPPAGILSFKFKESAKPAAKKSAVLPAAPKADPKVVALEKKLAAAKKKLEAAKAAGTATRNLEDKIYEIEDELNLAKQ